VASKGEYFMFIRSWAVLIALSLSTCAAQTAIDKPPEPESIGVFFYLDSATQTLKRLPKEDWKRHNKAGWTTVTTEIKLDGTSSSFRIPADAKNIFVFRASEDSAEKAKLYRFAIKGDRREFEPGKWKRRDYQPNPGVTVDIAKFGESSYKIVPETPLEPGEYALFTGDTAAVVFTFGVDPSGR
jgi:hypothetical protein